MRNLITVFFCRFNFTLPWGANFAVYGRRNVAPSITQYDFFEFVKGGRVDHRLKKRDLFDEGKHYQHSISNCFYFYPLIFTPIYSIIVSYSLTIFVGFPLT